MSSSVEEPAEHAPVLLELLAALPGTELLLIDGRLKKIAHSTDRIKQQVAPGVYTVRARIGDATRDQTLVVRPDQPVTVSIEGPVLASAMPLTKSSTSHEYHQALAISCSSAPSLELHPDGDAELFVLIREWTQDGKGRRDHGVLTQELSLCDEHGQQLFAFQPNLADHSGNDRSLAQRFKLRRGFYRLRALRGKQWLELPLYAISGRQKQVYLMARPLASGQQAVDFNSVAMFWNAPGTGFDPSWPDLRQLEWARLALQSRRKVVSDAELHAVLFEKYENPMLALLGAHALLQRGAMPPAELARVADKLQQLLGPLPDVVALKLGLPDPGDLAPVTLPPLLKRSCALLLTHSVSRPNLVARHSLAERVGLRVVGDGVWMCWRDDSRANTEVSESGSAEQAILRAARKAWRGEARARAQGVALSPSPSPEAAPALAPDNSALQRIVTTFGVPRALLEDAAADEIENEVEPPGVSARRGRGMNARSAMDTDERIRHRKNELFLERLLKRRPELKAKYEALLAAPKGPEAAIPAGALGMLELAPGAAPPGDMTRVHVLETLVRRERPVLFTSNGDLNTTDVTLLGDEAKDLLGQLTVARTRLLPLLPLVGRIDVTNFVNAEFLGTGWFVQRDVVVTNRHVAQLIARWDGRNFVFNRGLGGSMIGASLCNAHEDTDPPPRAEQVYRVIKVLYIERESGPNDIAFLQVERTTNDDTPPFIEIVEGNAAADTPVCVVGYPARAPKRVIPDQQLMEDLYRNRFDVKRVAPGYTMDMFQGSCTHDCTTLGGNSGSVVLELATGRAVGLHFAGLYQQSNYAVPASVLREYISRKRWNDAPDIGESEARPVAVAQPAAGTAAPAPQAVTAAAQVNGAAVSFTIPLQITLSFGTPSVNGVSMPTPAVAQTAAAALAPTVAQAKEAVRGFWGRRPRGVLGVRIGFLDDGDQIGETPCIAATVAPAQLANVQADGPREFAGVAVRYLPADVSEQIENMPTVEVASSVMYDDDARRGAGFSFDQVEEEMEATLHVGPEYSWDVLRPFLEGAQRELVSSMYEFHGPHIKKAIEARLKDQVKFKLVVDNATFSGEEEPDVRFDRATVFETWAKKFAFERVVAPEGSRGLISDSYHMKVTVRDRDSFWLSSGNWKIESSQPIVTQAQRDNASDEDIAGNREWHVVIKNKTLAERFRNHIQEDFKESLDLGGAELPASMLETLVDVPLFGLEDVTLERRPPSGVLEPLVLERSMKVTPLLTPDREGAVYSKAVLNLIKKAKKSLLFQIPYIGLGSNPQVHRGFIDDLIDALTEKMTELDDARLILRGGQSAGKKFSAPTHFAWHLKANGVDVANRVRTIENTHTKGMVVDGKRVLIGSHNWSVSGVTLNRDASLLFDDAEAADYYARAFEIDWQRANKVTPRKFIKPESALHAAGEAPPAGYMRVALSTLLKDD